MTSSIGDPAGVGLGRGEDQNKVLGVPDSTSSVDSKNATDTNSKKKCGIMDIAQGLAYKWAFSAGKTVTESTKNNLQIHYNVITSKDANIYQKMMLEPAEMVGGVLAGIVSLTACVAGELLGIGTVVLGIGTVVVGVLLVAVAYGLYKALSGLAKFLWNNKIPIAIVAGLVLLGLGTFGFGPAAVLIAALTAKQLIFSLVVCLAVKYVYSKFKERTEEGSVLDRVIANTDSSLTLNASDYSDSDIEKIKHYVKNNKNDDMEHDKHINFCGKLLELSRSHVDSNAPNYNILKSTYSPVKFKNKEEKKELEKGEEKKGKEKKKKRKR